MLGLEVIEDPAAAMVAMDPVRSRLLAMLAQAPASATQLAATLDLPRQRVNYHLRALEAHGLLELVQERPRRGVTERVLRASASAYLVSPAALGDAAPAAGRPEGADRLSARYLAAIAARAVQETGRLLRAAHSTGRQLPSLTLAADIRFRSAAERAAFTHELTAAVSALAARYHDESAAGGRWHRLAVLAYPRPGEQEDTDERS